MAVEQLLAWQAEALTKRAMELALAGDMVAMRLCMVRIAPVRKDRCVTFDLPAVKTPGDVTAALGAIVKAVSGGQMTPAEGETVGRLLDLQRLSMATQGFDERLAMLEEFAVKFRRDIVPYG